MRGFMSEPSSTFTQVRGARHRNFRFRIASTLCLGSIVPGCGVPRWDLLFGDAIRVNCDPRGHRLDLKMHFVTKSEQADKSADRDLLWHAACDQNHCFRRRISSSMPSWHTKIRWVRGNPWSLQASFLPARRIPTPPVLPGCYRTCARLRPRRRAGCRLKPRSLHRRLETTHGRE